MLWFYESSSLGRDNRASARHLPMRLLIEEDRHAMARWVAEYVSARINQHEADGEDRKFVLGLPASKDTAMVYRELVRLHKEGKVSFKNVVCFNITEWVGIPRDHKHSRHSFM